MKTSHLGRVLPSVTLYVLPNCRSQDQFPPTARGFSDDSLGRHKLTGIAVYHEGSFFLWSFNRTVVLGLPLGLWSVYCHVLATLTVSDMGFIAWNGP